MKQCILITGGFGYLGGRIGKYLATQTNATIRLGTRSSSQSEVPDWLKTGEVVSIDYSSEDSIVAACTDVTTIIHLAALNEIDSLKDAEKALIVNGVGTLKLLKAAELSGVSRFIYFSTAHVYGAPLIGSISEASVPKPVHPYAITHKVAEDFVLAAHAKKTLTGVVLRLSNGFGAPVRADVDRWTLLVNDLCRQAVVNKKLILHSPGLQWRDFITLDDICRAVEHFLYLSEKDIGDGLFNLGGACPLRIIDMAERIAERCNTILGFKPPIQRPMPTIKDSVPSLDYSIIKLQSTGFMLRGEINNEIDATLRLCIKSF